MNMKPNCSRGSNGPNVEAQRRCKGNTGKLELPRESLGSHREWMGHREHATEGISFESYISNTGDFLVDAKELANNKFPIQVHSGTAR